MTQLARDMPDYEPTRANLVISGSPSEATLGETAAVALPPAAAVTAMREPRGSLARHRTIAKSTAWSLDDAPAICSPAVDIGVAVQRDRCAVRIRGDGETLFCFPSRGCGRRDADPRIRSGADLSWACQNQMCKIKFASLAFAAIALANASASAQLLFQVPNASYACRGLPALCSSAPHSLRVNRSSLPHTSERVATQQPRSRVKFPAAPDLFPLGAPNLFLTRSGALSNS